MNSILKSEMEAKLEAMAAPQGLSVTDYLNSLVDRELIRRDQKGRPR
jgi:hypothetical protein